MARIALLASVWACSLLIFGTSGCAQETETQVQEPSDLQLVWESIEQGRQSLSSGDRGQAIRAAEKIASMTADPTLEIQNPQTTLAAADVLLRCGKYEESIPLFDQYIKASPRSMPHLWQRGIALYFAGDYALGAEQFEKHREVNPNDVENAAWHFMCLAKAESFEKAVASVLPAPNDSRVPMNEVHQLLTTGDMELVQNRLAEMKEGTRRRAMAEFFGDFYLGLYADAKGDHDQALEFLKRSAKDAPLGYMGDIARVYAEYLSSLPPQ